LLGVLSLRDLILAPRQARVRDIMEKEMVTVRVTEDREQVAREIARYDLLAIPVLDEQSRLVGIVTHDDVIDVVVQEATEDVHRMGAVAPMAENYLEAGFATVWRKRVGWLSLLFVAGSFTILALRGFQKELENVPVLALFIALCIGTGGNSGSQAATLITRALALGQLTVQHWFRVLVHELRMGLALGVSLGAMGFLICLILTFWILDDDKIAGWQLALIVSQAVTLICLWGTLVGSLLPLVFRSLGFDPAFASSPFVAIFVDVTGIVIYFTIAKIWLLG
jgi:magnesium transporter